MKTKFILFSALLLGSNALFAQNFNKTPYIFSDGVMETGKYIDFHSTDTGTSDYDARLQADPGMLSLTGGSMFLDKTETSNGWDYTHFFWSGHSLVMGSPAGYYKHNRIELKPGGSSLGILKSELFMYSTNTDYTSDLKIKLSTADPSYILGNLGVGTTNPQYPLDVYGTIRAREILVNLNGTADFVFKDNYNLKPIQEVYNYAKENKHLPDIPSEAEVVKNGMNMGDFQVKLLQKVEELTLYMAQQDKTIQAQQAKIKELEEKINK